MLKYNSKATLSNKLNILKCCIASKGIGGNGGAGGSGGLGSGPLGYNYGSNGANGGSGGAGGGGAAGTSGGSGGGYGKVLLTVVAGETYYIYTWRDGSFSNNDSKVIISW